MAGTRLSLRQVAPALLVLGVVAVSGLFYRTRVAVAPRGSGGPGSAVSQPGAVTSPHPATASPSTASASVAPLFQARVEELEARVAAEPENGTALLELARLLHDGHRAADAVPYYRRARALRRDDAQVIFDLASAHAEMGDWEAAASALLERLDDDPGDAVALYNLGAVRANQGRNEEADRLLVQAQGATSDGALLARISKALARLRGGEAP